MSWGFMKVDMRSVQHGDNTAPARDETWGHTILKLFGISLELLSDATAIISTVLIGIFFTNDAGCLLNYHQNNNNNKKKRPGKLQYLPLEPFKSNPDKKQRRLRIWTWSGGT